MVVFLNYLPIILIFVVSLLAYYWYRNKTFTGHKTVLLFVVLAAALTLLAGLGPSYLPKPEVARLSNPEFTESTEPVTDRLLKPSLTKEEREKSFDSKFDAVKQATK